MAVSVLCLFLAQPLAWLRSVIMAFSELQVLSILEFQDFLELQFLWILEFQDFLELQFLWILEF